MLPPLRRLIQRHVDQCKRHHIARRDCDEALANALVLARELAGDREEDEAAALLYALTREARALGDSWSDFPILEAVRVARSSFQHLDVSITDVALEELRLRVVVRGASFDDVRAFVAPRLRPFHLRVVR
ncbi:MAG: hypothetical protein QM820_60230 [Minicystis sp.]